jgi:hypothetical protein
MESEQGSNVTDLRSCDWTWIHKRIHDEFAPVMGVQALGVYVVLCRRENRTGLSILDVEDTAANLRLSETSVRKAVNMLERLDLIALVERVDEEGSRLPNGYYALEPPERPRLDWQTREQRPREVEYARTAILHPLPHNLGESSDS